MVLLSFIIPATGLLDQYVQLILMYIGINIILTVSLNLINGYMGEFSVGHAGFMAVGAYIASVISVHLFPAPWGPWLFPVAVAAGGWPLRSRVCSSPFRLSRLAAITSPSLPSLFA